MSTSSASALILIGDLDGSIYNSGLVHQISLSNLAGEYASINAKDEFIRTLGGSN